MSLPPEISFATGDGARLSFCITRRMAQDSQFLTTVETPCLRCSATSSTYMAGAPTTFFSKLAADWHGWNGEKRWADLEGRVSLTATADSLGHVTIKVALRGIDLFQERAEAKLTFEAGALENMSLAMTSMFSRF